MIHIEMKSLFIIKRGYLITMNRKKSQNSFKAANYSNKKPTEILDDDVTLISVSNPYGQVCYYNKEQFYLRLTTSVRALL